MSLIVIKITDGLGNQMFQYAYAKTLQSCMSQKVYLDISDVNNLRHNSPGAVRWRKLCDRREYQLDDFCITLPVIKEKKAYEMCGNSKRNYKFLNYCKDLRLLQTVYLKESECKESGIRYTKYQNYYVEGYFFDKCYNSSIESVLKKEFKLRKKICISKNIDQVLKTRNTVSLHIRRGDFLKVGRDISGNDYYSKAIEYLQERVKNPFLLVFSDDIEWVKRNKKFVNEHLFISDANYSDSEELALMSMCKNNIIANSTFSYWGAWLNNNKEKIVIAPRGWRKKIIPESWVVL